MLPISCNNTHHDVIHFVNHGMVKNAKTRISWERNITFLWNKKIINLCLTWHFLRSCFYSRGNLKRRTSQSALKKGICEGNYLKKSFSRMATKPTVPTTYLPKFIEKKLPYIQLFSLWRHTKGASPCAICAKRLTFFNLWKSFPIISCKWKT